jgi:hypothetical protein
MMAIDRGKDWKWYLNTNTIASPTYTLIPNQKDGNVDWVNNYIDTTTKDNLGWKTQIPSTRDMSTDMTCMYDGLNSVHVALVTASYSQTELQFQIWGSSGEKFTFLSYVDVKLSTPVDNVVEMSITFARSGIPVRTTS